MRTIKELFIKYKSIILYLVFGFLTTVVNWGSYVLSYQVAHIPNVPSTVIAWILGVLFAFVTNKLWVFDSRSWDGKTVWKEAVGFVTARALTGLMDVLIMWASVDIMGWNAMLWKLIANVLVVILNYFASKWIIFKKKNN